MIHELKCWPPHYSATIRGDKMFEIRKNDRNFKSTDKILLREWEPLTGEYTGRTMMLRITHVAHAETMLLPGFVVLGVSVFL